MKQKTLSVIGLVLMVVIGWESIISFIQSFANGMGAVIKSTPPIILWCVVLYIIWLLGSRNK